MKKRKNWSRKTIQTVFNKTSGKCFYCKCDLPQDTDYLDEQGKTVSSHRNWHIDHVIPISKGGTYEIDNLAPSCSTCNLEKKAKSVDEFLNGGL